MHTPLCTLFAESETERNMCLAQSLCCLVVNFAATRAVVEAEAEHNSRRLATKFTTRGSRACEQVSRHGIKCSACLRLQNHERLRCC